MTEIISPNSNLNSTEWSIYLKEKKFRLILIITLVLLIPVLIVLTNFLAFNETRSGITIDDPFLQLFKPVDLTWVTFSLIYGALAVAIIYLVKNPFLLLLALQSYGIMVIFRMLAMYSLPLNPPANIIILEDPFVQLFGNGDVLLKDLFFSGHTSTMFLLFLISKHQVLKIVFLLCTILVALCVLIQHVHYSIDVLAAPFFAYGSYRISHLILKKILN